MGTTGERQKLDCSGFARAGAPPVGGSNGRSWIGLMADVT
jgi:hypothetical protein